MADFPATIPGFAAAGFHKTGNANVSVLTAAIAGLPATISIADATVKTVWPAATFMVAVCKTDGSQYEQIWVSSRAGNVLTVGGRGQGGTTQIDHDNGSLVFVINASENMQKVIDELRAVMAEVGATGAQGFLRRDGTLEMTGDLDMGGQDIIDVATVDGRDLAVDGAKLDGIEAGATADQTAADIRGLGFFDITNDGAGSGLDADLLDGQHGAFYLARANHTGTQLAATISDFNEAAQDAVGGILTDSATIDLTYDDGTGAISGIVIDDSIDNVKLANMAQTTIKGRAVGAGTGDPVDLTAAEVVAIINTADGATSGLDADLLDGEHGSFYQNADNLNAGTLPGARFTDASHGNRSGGALHANATTLVAGFMSAADKTKLDGIEDLADVTDAANVDAAGAVMDADISAAEGILRKTGAGAYTAMKTNLAGGADPTVGDDTADGYVVGSLWINTADDRVFIATDVSAGAAIWRELGAVSVLNDGSLLDTNNVLDLQTDGEGVDLIATLAGGVVELRADLDIDSLATEVVPTAGDYLVITRAGVHKKVDWEDLPGAAGGAPLTSQYLLLAADALLDNERVFVAGDLLVATDGGAGGNYTLNVDEAEDFAWTGAHDFSGSLIVPRDSAPAQTAEGSLVWDDDDDKLTVGTGAGRKTLADIDSAQTFTNKTITHESNLVTATSLRLSDDTAVDIVSSPPTAGQLLTAVDADTASWQDPIEVDYFWAPTMEGYKTTQAIVSAGNTTPLSGAIGRGSDGTIVAIVMLNSTAAVPRILRSTDDGHTWAFTATTPAPTVIAGTSHNAMSVWVTDANTFSVTYPGAAGATCVFSKTTNGGGSWTTNTSTIGTGANLATLLVGIDSAWYATNNSTTSVMWALTTNAGVNFTTGTISTETHTATIGSVSIAAVDATTAYVFWQYNTGTKLRWSKTTNGGTNWSAAADAATNAVAATHTSCVMIDANTVLVTYSISATQKIIYRTTNGGTNWASVFDFSGRAFPGPVVADAPSLIYDGTSVLCIANPAAPSSVRRPYYLLESLDSGATWTAYNGHSPFTGTSAFNNIGGCCSAWHGGNYALVVGSITTAGVFMIHHIPKVAILP